MLKKNYNFEFSILFTIGISLFIAHCPVLFGDFLRQDDWNATFWNINLFYTHPEFYNSVVEMFRPLSTIFILVGDYFSHDIQNAKYVRLFNIIMLCIASYITYIWLVKFYPIIKYLF